jgi:hypothetical protein
MEIRNSKLALRIVTPAQAGAHKLVDSRLRGNDGMERFSSSVFEFRISSFGVAGF